MKTLKKVRTILLSVFAVLVILAFRPIYNVSIDETESIQGIVSDVRYNHDNMDITFWLENDDTNYYINRGLESIENAERIFDSTKNNTVRILYVRHWTPLDPFTKNKHVSKVMMDERILLGLGKYSE